MAPLPGWDVEARFRPVGAVATSGDLPILVTRVEHERPEVAATVEAFVSSAAANGAHLQVIDVAEGQHGFDMLDHTEQSRTAVAEAMAWGSEALARREEGHGQDAGAK